MDEVRINCLQNLPNIINIAILLQNSKAQGNVSFSSDFRTYRLEWNPDGLHSFVDDQIVGSIQPPEGGFWGLSGFNNTNQNPWANGTIMAPFDQEVIIDLQLNENKIVTEFWEMVLQFFIAINVAVGGELFQDNCDNYPYPKPWNNSSPDTPMSSFWNKKDEWYPIKNALLLKFYLNCTFIQVPHLVSVIG